MTDQAGSSESVPEGSAEPLPVDGLTWSVLLGEWVAYAQAAVGLPDDSEGGRWRASVPEVIGLQAVWFALGQLDRLAADERALGVDRAGVLIARHRERLVAVWGEEGLPEGMRELLADAEGVWRERDGEVRGGR
ncbi:hypothetical protein [Mucisphaera sp.]|uniref:hypothetical protein n=1 Tax=Mucisphaera sp. TaxID=2913024 RepID=UPI003D0EFDCD